MQTTQADLGFDIPTNSRAIVDLQSYGAAVAKALSEYEADPTPGRALALSKAILNAAIDYSGDDVEILVSSSWGKDSTALTAVLTEVMVERRHSGLRVPRVIVMTAHTGNEFIDMEARIAEEGERLSRWAQKEGFAVEVLVVGPEPKNTLFAELIGAGRPLPSYSKSTKAKTSEWCVDRLKSGPIEKALQLARGRGKRMLHLLGVRSDESARRAITISERSEGMPFGLMSVAAKANATADDVLDSDRIGVQPIVHWSHEDLTVFMRLNMALWNAFSFETLKVIYRKAAGDDELNGGECRIAFTKDGGVTNVCSDLGGARMGCLTCVKSQNRSLMNYAAKDARYEWVNRVHKFIYGGIAEHQERMADIKAHGFDGTTLVPKNMTFHWRYELAVLVARAELESGFVLVKPEVEEAINSWWARSGILTVNFAMARADAMRWKSTGKMAFSWAADSANYDTLSLSLSEGIPGGIYAHLRHPEMKAISIPNLIGLAGRGNSFYPSLKAYIFRDDGRGGEVTVLTDAPSDIGRSINTDAVSGIEPFNWELIGVRDLTSWERQIMRGRMIFYRAGVPLSAEVNVNNLTLTARFEKLAGFKWTPGVESSGAARDLSDIIYANMELKNPCGEKEFIDYLYEGHFIADLKGKITAQDFITVFRKVREATILSEALSDAHTHAREKVMRHYSEHLQHLGADRFGGFVESRALISTLVKAGWDIRESYEMFTNYVALVRDASAFIQAGVANTELLNRLSNVVRHGWYDESYANEKLIEVLTVLGLDPGETLLLTRAAGEPAPEDPAALKAC